MKELSNILEAKNVANNGKISDQIYADSRLSYFQYKNGKRYSFANAAGSFLKYSVGFTGISHLLENINNVSDQVIQNSKIYEDLTLNYGNISNLFSSSTYSNINVDSFSLSISLIASSIFVAYTLAERYKEMVTFDASKRAFLIEGLTKDIRFEGVEELMDKTPTSSSYRYLHMMNNIMLKDSSLEHKLISLKNGFFKMKNFVDLSKNKVLSNIFEFKFINKIFGATTSMALKSIYDENIHQLNSLKSDYFKSLSLEMNFISPDIKSKLSILLRNQKRKSGEPAELIKEIHSINQNSLEDAYHMDMDQKLALKFSKIIFDSCKNNIFPKESLKKYELLSAMSTYKDYHSVVENDVHIEISKMAKHFLTNERNFINQYKNKSLVDIVSKIDNGMIQDGKINIKNFRESFYLIRDRYLNKKIFDTQNELRNFIHQKTKGIDITEQELKVDSQNSSSLSWRSARKTLIKYNKI